MSSEVKEKRDHSKKAIWKYFTEINDNNNNANSSSVKKDLKLNVNIVINNGSEEKVWIWLLILLYLVQTHHLKSELNTMKLCVMVMIVKKRILLNHQKSVKQV